MENYTFSQHRHNFAIWTASRAAMRGLKEGKTINVKKIIEISELQQFANDTLDYSSEEYDEFHSRCAQELIESFSKLGCNVGTNNALSYGRAAKIIAIYLKTSIVFCSNGKCNKSKVIHPPIDETLLIQMSKDYESLRDLKEIKWTNLDEKGYFNVVSQIKKHFVRFDWTLEEFWRPERL